MARRFRCRQKGRCAGCEEALDEDPRVTSETHHDPWVGGFRRLHRQPARRRGQRHGDGRRKARRGPDGPYRARGLTKKQAARQEWHAAFGQTKGALRRTRGGPRRGPLGRRFSPPASTAWASPRAASRRRLPKSPAGTSRSASRSWADKKASGVPGMARRFRCRQKGRCAGCEEALDEDPRVTSETHHDPWVGGFRRLHRQPARRRGQRHGDGRRKARRGPDGPHRARGLTKKKAACQEWHAAFGADKRGVAQDEIMPSLRAPALRPKRTMLLRPLSG